MSTTTISDEISVSTDFQEMTQSMIDNGFAHVRGLLSPQEVAEIRGIFEKIHQQELPGLYKRSSQLESETASDPLNHWPRVMHPHRFNARVKHYMLHPAVRRCLNAFFGEEPMATQSMFYFKPPGARGQALHQDNFYLMVQPGTCVAAWTAIDDCDGDNGAMMVVPGSHLEDVSCPEKANDKVSFTTEFVPVPKGKKAVLINMKAGDVLFFNGSVIHGSGPNHSKTRFRRSFICHYAAGSTERISPFYNPLITMDGKEITLPQAEGGGPCGTEWNGAVH